jgi:predicted DNA-binding WGR domain protein
MSTRRRFEFVEGTSSKFWEIVVEGAGHTVLFGRIGTDGQTKKKAFPSEAAARADADKLVKEKLVKGYREAGAVAPDAPPARQPSKQQPAMRTTLKPPRGKKPLVLVLEGVRLVVEGDEEAFPNAAAAKNRLEAILRDKQKEGYVIAGVDIIADEPPPEEPEYVHVAEPPEREAPTASWDEHQRWRVTFHDEPDANQCAALIKKLVADAPRVVQMICDPASPGATWAKALSKSSLPSVRDLIFDTYFQTQTRQGRNSLGDIRGTFNACPSLERAFLTGDLMATKGAHTTLRELYLLGDPLDPNFLHALAEWELPALERLVLSLASDAGPGDDDAALATITKIDAPKVTSIHVDSLEDVARVLDELAASKRIHTWKELRLSGSLDEDAILEVVERHTKALSQLDVLGLPTGDYLSSDADEKLRSACSSVRDVAELPELTLPAAYDAWRG